MAYTTISGNLTEHTTLTAGTYYLTVVCQLGSYNLVFDTSDGDIIIKGSGTVGFLLNGSGTCTQIGNNSVHFTSKNDNSIGETIDGSTGNPAKGDILGPFIVINYTGLTNITLTKGSCRFRRVTSDCMVGWKGTLGNQQTYVSISNWKFYNNDLGIGGDDWTCFIGVGAGTNSASFIGYLNVVNVSLDSSNTTSTTNGYGFNLIRSKMNSYFEKIHYNVTGQHSGIICLQPKEISTTITLKNINIDAEASISLIRVTTINSGTTTVYLYNSCLNNKYGNTCFINESYGSNIYTTINNCIITGAYKTGQIAVNKNIGTIVHKYNGYYNNYTNCFEGLDPTEFVADPNKGNLPKGCKINTNICPFPDGYAVKNISYEKSGSDTFDNLEIDENIYSSTGKKYSGTDKVTPGIMYALSSFAKALYLDFRFFKLSNNSGFEESTGHSIRIRVKESGGIIRDSSGLSLDKSILNEFCIEEHIITASDMNSKSFKVSNTIADTNMVSLTIIGGIPQCFGSDYTCTDSTTIGWSGLGLDGFIVEGDKVQLEYPI